MQKNMIILPPGLIRSDQMPTVREAVDVILDVKSAPGLQQQNVGPGQAWAVRTHSTLNIVEVSLSLLLARATLKLGAAEEAGFLPH